MRAVVLAGLLLLPVAQACEVTPMIDIDLDQEAPCLQGFSAVEDCDRVPAEGEAFHIDGILRYAWDADECTAESGVLQSDLHITLSGVASNPGWLGLTFAPEDMVVPAHEFYDPTKLRYDPATGRLYSEQEQEFVVTVEPLRAPDAEERRTLHHRDGIVVAFVKAHAEGEGTRETFAVSQLSFDARHLVTEQDTGVRSEPSESTPMPSSLLLVALLSLSSFGRSRRWRR